MMPTLEAKRYPRMSFRASTALMLLAISGPVVFAPLFSYVRDLTGAEVFSSLTTYSFFSYPFLLAGAVVFSLLHFRSYRHWQFAAECGISVILLLLFVYRWYFAV